MTANRILTVAHWGMGTTLLLGLFIVYILYGANLNLSIPVLVVMHIFLVLLATVFKVSYVARLTALKQLGRAAH